MRSFVIFTNQIIITRAIGLLIFISKSRNMEKTLPLKILIADDDQDDLNYMNFLFQQHKGFELVGSLYNGREVIDFISKAEDIPDVVLIDSYMPLMNGVEVINQLIQSDAGRQISFFLISSTAHSMPQNFGDASNVEFVLKPVNLIEVNDLPELILERLDLDNINKI